MQKLTRLQILAYVVQEKYLMNVKLTVIVLIATPLNKPFPCCKSVLLLVVLLFNDEQNLISLHSHFTTSCREGDRHSHI